jgi:hypothetical protein
MAKRQTQYSACRLIGSWIIQSAAYCNQILLVIFITFMPAQSYSIKRRALYLDATSIVDLFSNCYSEIDFFLLQNAFLVGAQTLLKSTAYNGK